MCKNFLAEKAPHDIDVPLLPKLVEHNLSQVTGTLQVSGLIATKKNPAEQEAVVSPIVLSLVPDVTVTLVPAVNPFKSQFDPVVDVLIKVVPPALVQVYVLLYVISFVVFAIDIPVPAFNDLALQLLDVT